METIRWTTDYLRRRGLENPRLDAELLMGHALGMERIQLFLAHDRPLSDRELADFKALVKVRAGGKSVAHIIGYREFWKTRFSVPEPVFVPRPETELLVERVLNATRPDQLFRLLDLCTGSGNIPVSILVERPHALATSVDIMPRAVETARANAKTASVDSRLEVLCQNAVEFLSETGLTFDFVTCNPPYVPTSEWRSLQPEVKDHEDRLAVDGGGDGLNFLRWVLPLIPRILLRPGMLLLEYSGPEQTHTLQDLMRSAGFQGIVVTKDLQKVDRMMTGLLKAAS